MHAATVFRKLAGEAERAEGLNRSDSALRPDSELCAHDWASRLEVFDAPASPLGGPAGWRLVPDTLTGCLRRLCVGQLDELTKLTGFAAMANRLLGRMDDVRPPHAPQSVRAARLTL